MTDYGRRSIPFEISSGNISGPIHLTNRKNRASVEKNGLLRSDTVAKGNADPIEGHDLTGVYFFRNPYVAHQEESEGASAHQDIWELTHAHRYDFQDDPHYGGDTAIYTSNTVPPQHLRRVGHTTANYEVHWHKEEDCPNGR